MYDRGRGLPRDYGEAVRWYRKAADQGLVPAEASLAAMYQAGHGVSRDYIEAYKWYEIAASREVDDVLRKFFAQARDSVALKMSPQETAEADRRAAEWKLNVLAGGVVK